MCTYERTLPILLFKNCSPRSLGQKGLGISPVSVFKSFLINILLTALIVLGLNLISVLFVYSFLSIIGFRSC